MAEKKPIRNRNNRFSNLIMISLILFFLLMIVFVINNYQKGPVKLKTSEFYNKLESSEIVEFESTPISGEINADSYLISGKLASGEEFTVEVQTADALQKAKDIAYSKGITYNDVRGSSYSFWSIFWLLAPIIGLVIIVVFMMRNMGGNSKAMDFGKSRARLHKGKTTTFDDVAGSIEEKQELEELIDFLKNPKKYLELGARIPKGVLLVGPPGTGKTLLARAVAGEAHVPFYFISGSDFLEMFVGVGASRVRDMFKTAKQNAPCILFIDEIDAVGRQRGTGLGGGHDEREQTLNQLLVEMDGFGHNSGVIVMAATNRPDVLDPALLRAGRFDRQVTIGNPDIREREAILKLHSRNKKINPSVTFNDMARRTPGFSGADLENLLNEAAILCARENKKEIEIYHIDEAVDRVMMGPAKKSRIFSKRERDFIAHHEAGHAVIGLKLDNANIVHKVTIIPRGQAGGYNLMLPEEEESFLVTKQGLLDRITGLLGGRVAEDIVFNEISTGAHNDFQKATAIARAMVTEYGMSKLGPIQYEKPTGNVFLGRDYTKDRNFSDQVALEIDKEVREIISISYDKAKEVLQENMHLLKRIAHYLLEVETLTKEDITEIVENDSLKWWEEKVSKEKTRKEETNNSKNKPEEQNDKKNEKVDF